ncbi:hypothetical protein AGLY_003443 [Aphis glycines]|uniref:Uncharacterized protein n=1 Tax=Aphis glycines TaxID=307491 RepID=A0A6G0U254_APHGL|nr:hypothetical protein AGLY_003443 [Aphis glycines]
MVNENVLVNHIIELAFLTGNEVHGSNFVKMDSISSNLHAFKISYLIFGINEKLLMGIKFFYKNGNRILFKSRGQIAAACTIDICRDCHFDLKYNFNLLVTIPVPRRKNGPHFCYIDTQISSEKAYYTLSLKHTHGNLPKKTSFWSLTFSSDEVKYLAKTILNRYGGALLSCSG